MTIEVLVCSCDGTQRVELRQVPEDWLDPKTPKAEDKK